MALEKQDTKDGTSCIKSLLNKRDSLNRYLKFQTVHMCRTPLHLAANNGSVEIAKLLIKHGADVCALANDSHGALHFAAKRGHADIAELLIKKGASVGAKTAKWFTPLHFALQGGHVKTAAILVSRGAVQKYNSSGRLPFDLASPETLESLQAEIGNEKFFRLRDTITDKKREQKAPVCFYNRKRRKGNEIPDTTKQS
ncbi:bifunctional Ankyrin repeat/Ankyrin repeat-containing domain superfamily [Babesia duncani]|uniref:Bifunctional Ankyrin repeat/Ankyrin repeat-containing domain superfamily n=1 Tax=Babesia duncani TaxID=323732 RepID=A0AAD9PID8_9APIC|nr:bifunctional Ankyrin repeat/Ankyrin repeat-containing domain superfamily [Babesia duncani]